MRACQAGSPRADAGESPALTRCQLTGGLRGGGGVCENAGHQHTCDTSALTGPEATPSSVSSATFRPQRGYKGIQTRAQDRARAGHNSHDLMLAQREGRGDLERFVSFQLKSNSARKYKKKIQKKKKTELGVGREEGGREGFVFFYSHIKWKFY